jgi:hypothetical protein
MAADIKWKDQRMADLEKDNRRLRELLGLCGKTP